jgi:hypothetical protein
VKVRKGSSRHGKVVTDAFWRGVHMMVHDRGILGSLKRAILCKNSSIWFGACCSVDLEVMYEYEFSNWVMMAVFTRL